VRQPSSAATQSPRPISPLPTPETLVALARDCIVPLQKLREQHARDRRLSAGAISLLRERGFFRICQPREHGGYGLDPAVLWEVTREIARGDSATAWILSLAGLHPWLVGLFDERAQADVFANGGDAIVPVLSGGVARGVTAAPEDGGYRINGLWQYASGVDIATWLCVMAPVQTDQGIEQYLMLVPQQSFRIDHDSWHVSGMQGTGSKDVYLDNEFVPSWRVLNWNAAQRAADEADDSAPTARRLPLNPLFAMSIAAAVVGVAYGMLDTYRDVVGKRILKATGAQQSADHFTHAVAGQAASEIGMAYALLMNDVKEMASVAHSGKRFTVEQRTRYRADAPTVANTAVAGAMRLVRNLGGSLLPEGPVEQHFRDLHCMASHFLLQTEPAVELYGRQQLGVELPTGARI